MEAGTCYVGKRRRNVVFAKFKKLPCELRLMIWEASMTPRLVPVKFRPCHEGSNDGSKRENHQSSAIQGFPALLAVSQEARSIALRHYTWRFTINTTISHREYRITDLGDEVEHRRARVVMSPEDTLGLFRFRLESERRVWISESDVQVANHEGSPWSIHETTDAPQHGFKKVAILGGAIESNPNIVRALNITLWDLDSILHGPSAEMRTACSPHTKHKIFVETVKMPTSSWSPSMLSWINQERLLENRKGWGPGLLTYELPDGDKGAEDWKELLAMLAQRYHPRISYQ